MSDSDEDKNIPDGKVCEARCQEFAELTSTDTACAQFFLQDTDWDVSRAVNAYFDSMTTMTKQQQVAATLVDFADGSLRPSSAALWCSAPPVVLVDGPRTSTPPRTFQFMTWNVDGLGENSMELRIKRVCEIIKCELPIVVHLQEVTPYVWSCMQAKLSTVYKLIAGNDDPEHDQYYTATLLKKDTADYVSHEIVQFSGSSMGRTLLQVKVRLGEVVFLFLNSHLESTAEFSNERKRQLSAAFKVMAKCNTSATVIFGGDLNLRDKELDAIGGMPLGVEDLWIASGQRDELKYTWDGRRNTNIDGTLRNARCRFDRVYLKQTSPSRLTIKHFGFVGLEKIAGCGRFPSDHWGLVAHFDILSYT